MTTYIFTGEKLPADLEAKVFEHNYGNVVITRVFGTKEGIDDYVNFVESMYDVQNFKVEALGDAVYMGRGARVYDNGSSEAVDVYQLLIARMQDDQHGCGRGPI